MINAPSGKRGRGRPKKSLDEVVREDLKVIGLTEDMTQDRRLWLNRIKVSDHRDRPRRWQLLQWLGAGRVLACFFVGCAFLGSDGISVSWIVEVCLRPLFICSLFLQLQLLRNLFASINGL